VEMAFAPSNRTSIARAKEPPASSNARVRTKTPT
jgi:hypothetical protein